MERKSKLVERRLLPLPRRCSLPLLALSVFVFPALGCDRSDPDKDTGSTTGVSSDATLDDSTSVPEETSSKSSEPGEQGPTPSSTTGATGSSGTSTESSDQDASSSSSEGTTSSQDESDDASTKDQAPLPEVRVQIKPDTQLCGLANGMVTTFQEGFTSKQRLFMDEADLKTGALTLQGTLQNGEQSSRFEAKILNFTLSEQLSGAQSLIAGGEPGTFADASPFELGLALSPGPEDTIPTFLIDDWRSIAPSENYNVVTIKTPEPAQILGGNKEAAFGACAFPEQSPDNFEFVFENGDRVEFVTKTRKLSDRRSYQRGLLLEAKGSFRGIDIDVDQWESLVYAARNFAAVLRRPALAVQFPEQDGICALWLEPDLSGQRKAPYTAHLLNCEHEEIETLDPVEWTIPARFGVD